MQSQSDPKLAEILKQHGVDPDTFKQPPAGGFGGLGQLMTQMSERKQQLLA
jgi:hypothetical protein